MEPSKGGERTLAWNIVHWRSVVLVGASVAGGLVLTSMVIGATPMVGGQVAAAPEAVVAVGTVVDPSTTVLVDPSTTAAIPGSTDVVTVPAPAAPAPLAAPATGGTTASPAGRATPVAGTTQPAATPAAATPSPVQPTVAPSQPIVAPSQPIVAPSQRTVAPTTAAPTTAAPTTAAPTTAAPTTAAPTTAAPTTAAPTTAAPVPVALSYPSYTVSGVSGVSLQFDGSSIAVASVSPQASWVYQIASNGPRTVEIKFYNVATGTDREFHATVESGRIKVET